jgi:hypothetical protein
MKKLDWGSSRFSHVTQQTPKLTPSDQIIPHLCFKLISEFESTVPEVHTRDIPGLDLLNSRFRSASVLSYAGPAANLNCTFRKRVVGRFA